MTKDNLARNEFCKLRCKGCGKYVPAEDVEVAYSTDGHIIFSHHNNHLLEVVIDASRELSQAEARGYERAKRELQPIQGWQGL